MKRLFTIAAALLILPAAALASEGKSSKAQAVKEHLENHVQVHGFIRNYFAFDTRESVSGTGDLFYYVPKDEKWNATGTEDLNAANQFRFLALTSRLWVDVAGYRIQNTSIGAKIEADFYCGLTGSTGTAQLRLRQAYVTLGWEQEKSMESLKIGQAWHPMAADMPDIFSLNTGAPFGPFSRTPVVQFDGSFGKVFGLTAAAIWEMQYPSQGPEGKSANYIKYGCTPEFYLGVNLKAGGFLARVGADVHSIKPRRTATVTVDTEEGPVNNVVKVKDRITTVTPFLYMQYKTQNSKVPFSVKAKTVYAQAGEHLNLNGGYGVSAVNEDGSREYTPTRNSSTWVSLSVGKKFQGVLFGGYVKNFGTAKPLVEDKDHAGYSSSLYFSGNSFSNMNQMWRLTPAFMYNLGKFTVGLEYELTSVQYGKYYKYEVGGNTISCVNSSNGLATDGLHWVTNHRIQAMVKFTF
ncbi:MAG: hypothetical protein PUA47_07810 [Bacteroidales bacterium]|nr:hypothetical protein [Bacteroidales bacterium]